MPGEDSRVAMPANWDDHKGWDAYYRADAIAGRRPSERHIGELPAVIGAA